MTYREFWTQYRIYEEKAIDIGVRLMEMEFLRKRLKVKFNEHTIVVHGEDSSGNPFELVQFPVDLVMLYQKYVDAYIADTCRERELSMERGWFRRGGETHYYLTGTSFCGQSRLYVNQKFRPGQDGDHCPLCQEILDAVFGGKDEHTTSTK